METITLFDIPITNATLQETVCLIRKYLAGEESISIHFVNAHCVNIAKSDADYLRILQNTDYVFADGIGMKIAALIHGVSLRDNVNGTDLYPLLLDSLADTGYRIFLLGAEAGIAEEMKRRALESHPDMQFCGTRNGFIAPGENPSVVQEIHDAKPDLLLVAMGVPRQEKWLAANLAVTGAKVGIGAGGLFNFYSGNIPRAPLWMRRIGLEWFHRFLMEPGRMWNRYLIGNMVFLFHTILIRLKKQ